MLTIPWPLFIIILWMVLCAGALLYELLFKVEGHDDE